MSDDRERPGPLTLIRPLGTTGLPNAYERPLKREVSLDLSADADIPGRFIAALGELIREVKTTGAGQKRYELKKGRRGEATGGDILYRFPFTEEVELFGEAQIEIRVNRRRIEGTIASSGAGQLILALKEDIGNEVPSAMLLIYATAFLEALKEKIEAVNEGDITLNRTLADAVVQPGPLPKRPTHPIRANDGYELDDSQRKAYQTALREALTFIWGPPGCGKTITLSAIVHSAFNSGKRTLICSNTNKAVDQVLYKICETLTHEHSAMEEGKVIRLGRIADDKLASEYRKYVEIDEIVERHSAELKEKKSQLEAEIARVDAETQNAQKCLARFKALDKTERRVKTEMENVNQIAYKGQALQKELSHNSNGRDELDAELKLYGSGIFKFFRRSKEAIQADIQRNEMECQQIETRIRELKEQYATARQHFEQTKQARDDLRSAVAGKNRTSVQAIINKSKQKRDRLVAKIGEIEAEIAALRKTVLRDARIVGATCTTAYLTREIGQFDLVIIDEASMVLRPEVWFSAGLARKRVVISGDFRQIPPIVTTQQEAIFQELGLDPFTATERTKPDAPGLIMLTTQYRMHPEICGLISGPMYEDELRTSPAQKKVLGRLPPNPFEKPLTIIDTSDLWPFESQNASFSRFNTLHALLVRKLVWHFRQNGVIETNHDLGICTPYAAQARLIQKLFEEHSLDSYVHCGTVHRFQGDERRIVLLEIPESYGGYRAIGQLVQGVPPDHAGARLISVAVSRAQEHFVVLANLTYLDKHLPSLSLLRGILHEMQQQGHVVPVRELLKYPIDRDVASSSSLDHVKFDEMAKSMGIFNEEQFERKLANDIQSAKESVVLFSGYVTPARVAILGDLLRSRILAGVKVRCVTRPPKLNGSIPESAGRRAVAMLESIGAVVDFRANIHQKVCLIDNEIVWWGSLNALSHMGYADEMMTRVANDEFARAVAVHMSKRPVSSEKAQTTVAEAENPRCERCGTHSVFKESRYGPYFECELRCGWKWNMKTEMKRTRSNSNMTDVEFRQKRASYFPQPEETSTQRSADLERLQPSASLPRPPSPVSSSPKAQVIANNSQTEEFKMQYEVSNIAAKLISTDDKDVTVAIKATVKNNSDNERVFIDIQGVDADGFEMEYFSLMGDIPIGESRTLTRQRYIERKLYEQITHWQRQ